ncbi:Protein of unknown function DUF2800 [uncultured Caudovirales phage]|uniref:PD-(D/E)XK endonuclease-like domain-containing protein n=1 Tax=uncultured Caudovirales phage TaxID=2100421 RepID=A0A6J5NFE3_9CAUD|nr:Protein of unknown function DUF2800 [uncultured Caudovirales phage]
MSATYTNPFQHVPSASKLGRVMECPASHKAELAAGDVPEDLSDANEGTDVHAVLSDDLSVDDVSYSAAQTAEMCEDQTERLLNEWQTKGDAPLGFKELRYGLTDIGAVVPVNGSTRANVVFTGQFDRLYTQGERGLLIDFKALHGKHKSAIENPQLMGLAVLVAKRHKLTSLRVALVQPWKGKPTVADYGESGLALASSMLLTILDAEHNAAPHDRKAGDHCTFCKVKPNCWAWKKQAQKVEHTKLIPIESTLAQSMSPFDVAEFDALCSRVIVQAQKGRAWVQAMVLKNPERFSSHFTTEESEGRATITDLSTVWQRLEKDGIPHDKFLACLTARKDDSKATGLPGLKGELRRALKIKGRELDDKIKDALNGCVTDGKKKTIAVRIGSESLEDVSDKA